MKTGGFSPPDPLSDLNPSSHFITARAHSSCRVECGEETVLSPFARDPPRYPDDVDAIVSHASTHARSGL